MTKAIVIGSGAGGLRRDGAGRGGLARHPVREGPQPLHQPGREGPIGTSFGNDSLAMIARYRAEPDPEVYPRTLRPTEAVPA